MSIAEVDALLAKLDEFIGAELDPRLRKTVVGVRDRFAADLAAQLAAGRTDEEGKAS